MFPLKSGQIICYTSSQSVGKEINTKDKSSWLSNIAKNKWLVTCKLRIESGFLNFLFNFLPMTSFTFLKYLFADKSSILWSHKNFLENYLSQNIGKWGMQKVNSTDTWIIYIFLATK